MWKKNPRGNLTFWVPTLSTAEKRNETPFVLVKKRNSFDTKNNSLERFRWAGVKKGLAHSSTTRRSIAITIFVQ